MDRDVGESGRDAPILRRAPTATSPPASQNWWRSHECHASVFATTAGREMNAARCRVAATGGRVIRRQSIGATSATGANPGEHFRSDRERHGRCKRYGAADLPLTGERARDASSFGPGNTRGTNAMQPPAA